MAGRSTSGTKPRAARGRRGIEARFDAAFAARLGLREKQIQQSYRPVIGVHKWFARRPGTLFRALLLAERGPEPLAEAFFRPHRLAGVIADPFMGGGTPVFEANRLGFDVVGCDINPMAHWIVRQSLTPLDAEAFAHAAAAVAADVERQVGALYQTSCLGCGQAARVKYFLWVKTAGCPACGACNDLFPGYLLAEAERHPRHVLACAACGALNETETVPTRARPATCTACGGRIQREGNVQRRRVDCRACRQPFTLGDRTTTPEHRLWALEYHCAACYPALEGRQFKTPDADDLGRVAATGKLLAALTLPIPDDEIPAGDETDRLHRWGYRRYRELFNERQRLGLGLLLARIQQVADTPVRHALLTVFSDTLRYQNLLCRYDTYALKCQDVFSLHGFPVGLVVCENTLLGADGVGSGSFRHFAAKYARAKAYCAAPFETRHDGGKKRQVPLPGESIAAALVDRLEPGAREKQALLRCGPSQEAPLAPGSLDGVFTDPPYFDNVQYAELMDFCFVWLRRALAAELPQFRAPSTRAAAELTGNGTLGRGLAHFTAGMAQVFTHFAAALKPGAPFVFTYHHNDPEAYLPLIVAILDAGLTCTATLPAAAEMTASLHIAGTSSSILDSVFVCRRGRGPRTTAQGLRTECRRALAADAGQMRAAGVKISAGDLRCLAAGHLARFAIRALGRTWDPDAEVGARLAVARATLDRLRALAKVEALVAGLLARRA
jgi:adenine-specific DNA methylase